MDKQTDMQGSLLPTRGRGKEMMKRTAELHSNFAKHEWSTRLERERCNSYKRPNKPTSRPVPTRKHAPQRTAGNAKARQHLHLTLVRGRGTLGIGQPTTLPPLPGGAAGSQPQSHPLRGKGRPHSLHRIRAGPQTPTSRLQGLQPMLLHPDLAGLHHLRPHGASTGHRQGQVAERHASH